MIGKTVTLRARRASRSVFSLAIYLAFRSVYSPVTAQFGRSLTRILGCRRDLLIPASNTLRKRATQMRRSPFATTVWGHYRYILSFLGPAVLLSPFGLVDQVATKVHALGIAIPNNDVARTTQ